MTGPQAPAARRLAFALALIRRRTGRTVRWPPPSGLRRGLPAGNRTALAAQVAGRRRMLEPGYVRGVLEPPPDRSAEPGRWPPPFPAGAVPPRHRTGSDPTRPAATEAAVPAPIRHGARPSAAGPSATRPAATGPPPAGPGLAEPPSSVLHAGSMPLPHRTQAHLARLLDRRLPAVRLHVGPAADAVLRDRRADALTFGRHVLVRTDRYAPDRPAGLALLGHEVAHAAHNVDPAVHPVAPHDDEAAALGVEQRIRRAPDMTAAPPPVRAPAIGPPSPAAAAPPPAAPAPQAALTDRPLAGPAQPPDTGPPLSGPQLRQLTEHVYRDILSRIRTE
jgi:hypothetical protein